MKVVVLGAGGQVGASLAALLPDARALTRAELDVTDPAAVAAADFGGADVIVNAAAYTAVDRAETPAGRAEAWRANAIAPGLLARAADAAGATLVHFSTEYVHDGASVAAWTEDDPIAPLSAYGATKAAGDLAVSMVERHYVVRTTWVVGSGANFVATMLGLAAKGVSPTVVADQIGRPTFADDLARGVVALVGSGAPFGTYNVTNTGEPASWADVARATFALAGRSPADVSDTTTAEYFAGRPEAARRPLNSVLNVGKAAAAGVALPDWHESLAAYVASR
ncbi:SDR family oxidoreductase [Pseudonocardia sp. GCM10023141]|uniref:SDR family oxidoreductase n=1 Tax=Pseudonocardia sp. GCM10023141 TaxID=3252653 RepID=UPI0036228E48